MKIHHCGLNCLRRENIHATFYIYANINLPYKGVWIYKKRVGLCEKERTWEELIQNERENQTVNKADWAIFFTHRLHKRQCAFACNAWIYNKSVHTTCLSKLFSLSLYLSLFFLVCRQKNSIFFSPSMTDFCHQVCINCSRVCVFFSWYFFNHFTGDKHSRFEQ